MVQEGSLERIFPWQLAKLQQLLVIGGAWWALVGIVVLISYLLYDRLAGSESPKPPSPGRSRTAILALSLLLVGYSIAYGWLVNERHNRFNSSGYDLAIKEQVVWNTVRGHFFASSVEVENAFADHFQPLMLALVPLYALVPSTKLLLWVQTLGLAAGAVPLYRFARRRLNSIGLALAIAAAYLLYPAVGFVNRFDFHPEALAISAFIAAFDALDRDKLKAASFWLLVPLLSKENLGFSVAAFGLYAALFRRRIRFGLAWAGLGLAVSSITMFWLIPTLRHGPSDTLARYAWLGETPSQMLRTLVIRPRYVWQNLADPNRGLYLLQLLVPTGFLALLGLPEVLLAAPGLVINLLAQHHCQSEIYCQYTVPIIPFLFIATVVGLERLGHFLRHQWTWYVIGLAVVPLSLLALGIDNPFTEAQELPAPLVHLPNAEAVHRALATVPPEASVVTTNAYAPHLAQREGLYIIGIPAQREPPPDPDVVFVNLYDQRFIICEQYREYFTQLDIDRYGVIFRDCGMIVIQRDGGSNEGFRDFLLNWTDCAG
ncbi:MAG: DUF2079 domain-containing protein [Chloroflexi bacterium]|nr:DUF2079 domain-containing protein [Chloroflexota bacterium]